MKRSASYLVLLLVSYAFLFTSQIWVVKAEATIYISNDGSVVGTDFLQRSNNTYTFLNDISGNIVVSKDNITIDGAGFTLKGSGDSSETGIDLTLRNNVTIRNLIIIDYFIGINCRPGSPTATNITILNNYIRDCDVGIELLGCNDNLIKLNTFKNNTIDISINYVVGNNVITQNSIDSYIQVWMAEQPTIDMNYWADYNGTDSNGDGIGDTPYYHHDILQDSHPLIEPVPAIPEFPSWLVIPIFMAATLFVILYKKKLFNQSS